MPSLAPPPKYIPFTDVGPDGREFVTPAWYDWALRIDQTFRGSSTTVTLAKITGPGTDGSLTIVNGLITAVVQPT